MSTFTSWRGKLCLSAVVTLAVCSASGLAHADGRDYHEFVPPPLVPKWVTIPAELGNAAVWACLECGPTYQWRLGVLPGVVVADYLSFHSVVQAVYRNPDWDIGLGLRPVVTVGSLVKGFVPVRLLAEGSYLPVTRGGYVGGGVMLGLGRLLYVALLGGSELDRHNAFFGVRLGGELTAWGDPIGAVIRDLPQTDAPRP